MVLENKRILGVGVIVPVLLLIPLIAMRFTAEVNWNLADFFVAGVLLLITGFAIEFVSRKTKHSYRLVLYVAIVVALLLVWAELAVGIFGTPLAGS